MNDSDRTRILLVCMGNICRSPTAHGVLRARARQAGVGHRLDIQSAGTHGYHVGSPPDRRAIRAAGERRYDLSDLRARQVEPRDLEVFDYVLAMDRDNLAILRSLQGPRTQARISLFMDFADRDQGADVPDPYYGGANGFERVLDMIEAGVDGLLVHLRRGRADG